MQALDGTPVNPGVGLSEESDIIRVGALRNVLARSREIIAADLETPYSRRFYATNDFVGTQLEDQSIRAIINERQQQSDAALRQISDLQTVMKDLKVLRRQLVVKNDRINRSMNLHKQLASALWRLPTEVLSHIFNLCLLETSHMLHPSKARPPILTRICRRWREVAVGMPTLWCRLLFHSHEVGTRHWESMAFCYDLWLKRSRGLPLSLKISCDADTHSITKLRSFLRPYTTQILSLSVTIPYAYAVDIPELLFNDFLELQELTISMWDRTKMPLFTQSISQLLFNMRSLKIQFPVFNPEDFSAATPLLARLTNIEVAIDKLHIVPHLLHLCPDLSSLTICAGIYLRMESIESFTHSKLRSLRIAHHLRNAKHLSHLFNALSLPGLRLLETRYIESTQTYVPFDDPLPPPKLWELEARYAQPWPHAELKALLARSNCPMEGLHLGGGVMMTDEQRAEYVALIPSLDVVVDSMRQDHTSFK